VLVIFFNISIFFIIFGLLLFYFIFIYQNEKKLLTSLK